mmetsp:Transcript_293/g.802  ORF Transcript_293/g.802 Transcript_293/m.802 type:complete len:254 (+) Transcript_293:551-1312(+)
MVMVIRGPRTKTTGPKTPYSKSRTQFVAVSCFNFTRAGAEVPARCRENTSRPDPLTGPVDGPCELALRHKGADKLIDVENLRRRGPASGAGRRLAQNPAAPPSRARSRFRGRDARRRPRRRSGVQQPRHGRLQYDEPSLVQERAVRPAPRLVHRFVPRLLVGIEQARVQVPPKWLSVHEGILVQHQRSRQLPQVLPSGQQCQDHARHVQVRRSAVFLRLGNPSRHLRGQGRRARSRREGGRSGVLQHVTCAPF